MAAKRKFSDGPTMKLYNYQEPLFLLVTDFETTGLEPTAEILEYSFILLKFVKEQTSKGEVHYFEYVDYLSGLVDHTKDFKFPHTDPAQFWPEDVANYYKTPEMKNNMWIMSTFTKNDLFRDILDSFFPVCAAPGDTRGGICENKFNRPPLTLAQLDFDLVHMILKGVNQYGFKKDDFKGLTDFKKKITIVPTGRNPNFDWALMGRDLKQAFQHLSYRLLDVTTLDYVTKMIKTQLQVSQNNKHRAHFDNIDTITSLTGYFLAQDDKFINKLIIETDGSITNLPSIEPVLGTNGPGLPLTTMSEGETTTAVPPPTNLPVN